MNGLQTLTRLKHLSIQFAPNIPEEDVLSIMKLTSLTSLDFTWLNHITSKTLQELTRLSNLNHLELLSNSGLNDEDYTVLRHLTKLTFLDLSYINFPTNSKAIEAVATLTQLTALLILEDMETSLNLRDMQALTSLTKLKYLQFVVKRPILLKLAVFNNLQELVINHSKKIVELINITILRKLRVENTSLKKEVIEEGLCKMTQLTMLELCSIKSFDIDAFARHSSNLKNLLRLTCHTRSPLNAESKFFISIKQYELAII